MSGITNVVLNMGINDIESLKSRWRRLRATQLSLWTDKTDIHILGYSLGCHLAVKFAAEAAIIKRVKELVLIAPDPKFQRNLLDDEEFAYEQATELWHSAGCPGDDLCLNLRSVSEEIEQKIHVIYSEDDTVALWKDNVEIMKRKCGGDRFQWSNVTVSNPAENDWFRVQLEPSKARGEFWIHEQVFTNVTNKNK